MDIEAALIGHCSYNLIQLPSKWRERFPPKSRHQRRNNPDKKKYYLRKVRCKILETYTGSFAGQIKPCGQKV